jgi:hypothetical protein
LIRQKRPYGGWKHSFSLSKMDLLINSYSVCMSEQYKRWCTHLVWFVVREDGATAWDLKACADAALLFEPYVRVEKERERKRKKVRKW